MSEVSAQLSQIQSFFERELGTIRTGRASPRLIEDLPIECYGQRTPLQQLASINAPEPQLLVVQPWDASLVKDIEKALSQSKLGINPVVDGKVIRLPFPSMTEERRKELLKSVGQQAEEAKISIRHIREEQLKKLKQQEKDGQLSEDDLALATKQLQQAIDAAVQLIDTTVASKTQELMTL